MNINITFAPGVSSAAQAVVNSVVQLLDSQFTDPITINITVTFGSIAGIGKSNYGLNTYTYAQLRTALINDETSNDDAVGVAATPSTDPIGGTHTWTATPAEAKALGLIAGNGTASDGTVTFSNTAAFDYDRSDGIAAGQYDFYGSVAHEITEVMGRELNSIGNTVQFGGGYHPLDVFKFSSAGTHAYVGTTAGYFSLDNGTTDLADFYAHTDEDFGDWASSAGNDSFRAVSNTGVVNAVTETDLRELDAIGYNRVTSNEKLYFSDDRNQLFRTDPLTFGAVKIGNLSTQLTDLAVAPDGTLYGVSFNNLYLVNSTNATLTLIGALGVPQINALVFDTAGHAFAASDTNSGLYSVNIATGAATLIGNNGRTSDGDLAFIDSHLYMATNENSFVELDPHTGSVISSVADGITNLFGLAFSHGAMFGFAGSSVYTIDPQSGASHLYTTYLSSTVGNIFGAATDGFGQTGNVVRGLSGNDTLSGTALNDVIFGFSGQDVLSGLGGNDTINGGPGNDTIDGGDGIDTAVFSGLRSAYSIMHVGNSLQVSGPDGLDTLTNIERLAFDNVTVPSSPAPRDFNADGISDVFWRNDATGHTGIWQMQNNVPTWHDLGGSGVDHKVAGFGDFNGDGTADVFWRNDATGHVGTWEMHNDVPTWHDLGGSGVDHKVVGVGDFSGDGTSDIFWRNDATGHTGFWEMHDNVQTWRDLGGSGVDHKVVGVGDFNGDGTSDVLWRNDSTGHVGIWEMHNNVQTWRDLGGSGIDHKVAGVGDFNGDGTSDILWRNDSTGHVGVWEMHNGAQTWRDLGGSGTDHKVAGIGDYSGDGTSDVFWRNDVTGHTGFWEMHNNVPTWHDLGGSGVDHSFIV
jgi:hypothetical protein